MFSPDSHSRIALTQTTLERMLLAGWLLLLLPIVLAFYAYGLYPLILRLLGRSPITPASRALQSWPVVSIVVPAYNEERQIRGAIEALLAQDYPAERRQILILSDASTDRTDEIVLEYRERGVELLRMPVRGGKTAAENASCAVLRGEIIVNSDSSVRLDRTAIRRLVSAMADPSVGVASTRDVSVTNLAETTNAAEAGYVDYEMRIRGLETRCGGIVGASGSGYAIRSHLHRLPVRADLSRDFSAALTAHTHGYRTVSVEDAICYVPRTPSIEVEYRRKVRTIARGMETLLHNGRLRRPHPPWRICLEASEPQGLSMARAGLGDPGRAWSHSVGRCTMCGRTFFSPSGSQSSLRRGLRQSGGQIGPCHAPYHS